MGNYVRRTRTTVRHEYAIASPAIGKELGLAIAAAERDMPESRRGYDDAWFIKASDDEIIVWWPSEEVIND